MCPCKERFFCCTLSFVGSTVFECEQTVFNLSYYGNTRKCAEFCSKSKNHVFSHVLGYFFFSFFTKSTLFPNERGQWWRGPAAQPTLVVSVSAQAKRAKKNRDGHRRHTRERPIRKTRREQDMYTEVQCPHIHC